MTDNTYDCDAAAERGLDVIITYANLHCPGEEDESVLRDILSDLRHLFPDDFNAAVMMSEVHVEEETAIDDRPDDWDEEAFLAQGAYLIVSGLGSRYCCDDVDEAYAVYDAWVASGGNEIIITCNGEVEARFVPEEDDNG